MSTYGAHTDMTASEARAVLPSGACRDCLYRVRCPDRMAGAPERCPRCGITRVELLEARQRLVSVR